MRSRKQICQDRIRRMVAHRDNPAAPVDAATLLHNEGQRLRNLKHPLAAKAGWAMLLAAAKLESWGDPACMVRYARIEKKSQCSSFGPGCRVKVNSSSTYKGRYGTITEANGMLDRWFVAIDDDDCFSEVSFYARELIYIPEDK